MKKASQLLLIIVVMIITSNMSISVAEDSIPSIELKEVEVRGENSWIDPDGTMNFIPTKKEKRLSNDPASLVKSMHITVLKEKDGSIQNLAGESVTIFINGIRANETDLSTFWPRDVKSVQYMENPKNPAYEGARHVVNFIIKQYTTGGVSRTNLTQKIPNYGYYTTSAKLVNKKMTFGAMVQGIYSREHRASQEGETKYKNLYYQDKWYDEIVSSENSYIYERENIINSAINARYATNGFMATHTLSLGWLQNPGSGSESTEIWTDNLFKSSTSSAHSTFSRLTPQISGDYYRRLSNKWHLFWAWGYAHAYNKDKSDSRTGQTETIFNRSKESIDRLRLSVSSSYILSPKWYFQLQLRSSQSWYSTQYSGSVNKRQTQTRNESLANFTAGWTPSQSFRLVFQPGVLYSQWHIGNIDEHSFKPTAAIWASWTASRKFNLSGNVQFVTIPPYANESNPVMTRTSELMWTKGNPNLKSLDAWETSARATYMPTEDFSLALRLLHARAKNEIVPDYTAAPREVGGIIKCNRNAAPSDNLTIGMPISWTGLNDNLSIEFSPEWEHSYFREKNGEQKKRFDNFHFSAEADYTIGNCRFELSYVSPYHGFDYSGMERDWRQNTCSLAFVYGTDNLYLKAAVENIFHNKAKYWSRYYSGYFATDYNNFSTGRRFFLTLSYTFGFRRKVDKSIDISGPESISSSVSASK